MRLVCMTAKQERCARAYVGKSGLITRLNVFQGRLLAAGRVWDESGPGVHMLWHCRSKKMKVRVALQRQMDAMTHTTCAKKKKKKVRRADRQGRRLAAFQMPSETGGKGSLSLFLCVCVWGYSIWPKVFGHPFQPTFMLLWSRSVFHSLVFHDFELFKGDFDEAGSWVSEVK